MRDAIDELEQRASSALQSGDTSSLDIIGYGEISTVLKLQTEDGTFAAKRLPPFPADGLKAYSEVFTRHLTTLEGAGTTPVKSWLEVLGEGSERTVYCIQPMQDNLLVDRLQRATQDEADELAARLVGIIAGTVSDHVGLDGQVSNWSIGGDGELLYLDVTTPLLRDENGKELLDTDLFIASLPAALRSVVRRFLLDEILGHYYSVRAVLLDLIGNLEKEKLASAIPSFLREANKTIDEPITSIEANKYYRSDARMWELLQRLRLADRWWQRTIRRRTYPFILPGRVER